jgi:hypothetical protein
MPQLFFRPTPAVELGLDALRKLDRIIELQERTMAAIDDLNSAVTAMTSAVNAAVTEIQALAAKIGSNTTDPQVAADAQAINALAAQLQAAVSAVPATPAAPAA